MGEEQEETHMVHPSQRDFGVTSSGARSLESVRERSGWFIALGIGLAVLGFLAIVLPYAASLATGIFFGFLMAAGGIFQLVHAIQNRRWAGSFWGILAGLLYLAAGVLVVAFPVTGTIALTLIFAAFFAADGILKIIRAFQHRKMSGWGWLLFDGLLALALGVLIGLGWPSTAAWALGLLVGINLVFGGTSMVIIGLGVRRAARACP
jgi:uncharacterized membrane protein HdeD (DUF308 family)